MRFFDLVSFALSGLWRQKVRTALTILGVAVGATSLAFSLSLGVGLRRVITNEFHSRPGFWEIRVSPGGHRPIGIVPPEKLQIPDGVNPDRSRRLKQMLEQRALQMLPSKPAQPLTPEILDEIRQWPDVEWIRTYRHVYGETIWNGKRQNALFAATQCNRPDLNSLIIAGRKPQDGGRKEIIVPEILLYDLGARTDQELESSLGTQLTVELGGSSDSRQRSLLASLGSAFTGMLDTRQALILMKLMNELPSLIESSHLTDDEKLELRNLLAPPKSQQRPGRYPVSDTFTIVGVYRAPSPEEQKDGLWYANQQAVIASASGGESIIRNLHAIDDGRFDNVEVKVLPGGDLPAVVAKIEENGFRTNSSLRWFDNSRREVTAIAVALNIFAWISLIVAAIGITNTLVTNVVERTREIGILKALGGGRRQILVLFLLEGTLIGVLGGVLGLTTARLASGPADHLVRSEIQRQMQGQTMISTSVFEFPLWISLTTLGAAIIITTLAALYPARRASRIEPVDALKSG